jgi:hypothetical protein
MTTAAVSLDALREHIVTANYPAATEAFCALLKDGTPLNALVREAIETTAPFVQAPSHLMAKPDGTTRGVNYDHTVLGWRASLRLMPALPQPANLLPVAQAIWYAPQGLDVWSQVQCDFPGHYARDQERCDDREHLPPYDPPRTFDRPCWTARRRRGWSGCSSRSCTASALRRTGSSSASPPTRRCGSRSRTPP